MPDWAGSDRRQTLPPNWTTEIVPRIMRRDHHRCQWIRDDTGQKCGRRATDVDHTIRPADGGTDEDDNLRALCAWHHRWKTSHEGGIASARARRARKAAESKPLHPGLLERAPDRTPPPF